MYYFDCESNKYMLGKDISDANCVIIGMPLLSSGKKYHTVYCFLARPKFVCCVPVAFETDKKMHTWDVFSCQNNNQSDKRWLFISALIV